MKRLIRIIKGKGKGQLELDIPTEIVRYYLMAGGKVGGCGYHFK